MKSEIRDISPTQKEIHVQIDADVVKAAFGLVSQKYARQASVPGFRKGYAPLDVVRMRFREEIKSEVLQEIVPGAVTAAIEEHDVNPLVEPQLHLDDHENVKVNGSQPLSLHVHVEVMPEIPEPKFDDIEVTRRVKPVIDGEIEDLIAERLQKESALIPVEGRKSEIGDTVIADLQGVFEGDADAEPIQADGLEIELGGEHIERSFTDNLIGVEEDEEKEFTVVYPAEFSSEQLAGKTVHYKAKIKSVGRSEVPEANDDWAKSLDEGYESIADLRSKLRADLENYAQADADARLRNNAIAKLIENNSFEVPGVLIENQARNLLNNFAQDMKQRGVNLSSVEPQFIEMAYANMRQQAERDVRGAMLLDKVADAEGIEVAPEELDQEIAKMADYYRSTPEEIRQSLEKQGGSIENIQNNLRTRKAIEAVIARVKVKDGEWIDEAAAQAAGGADAEPAAEVTEEAKPKKAAKKKNASKDA
jgi:trigger factor